MRIVKLKEIKEEHQRHIRGNGLFPVIGSGFTKGCPTRYSGHLVPSGTQMKEYMIQYLAEHGQSVQSDLPFSRAARYYETIADQQDYWHYFRDNFTEVELPDPQCSFLAVNWKCVYTLNLDDAIECNSRYKEKILPNRNIRVNALEPYRCVFKLHGDAHELVTYQEKNSAVLSITEYISSLSKSKSMLDKLTQDLNYSNAIFVGCSLKDELDLLSVANELNSKNAAQINRYYVTRHSPSVIEQVDLADYGIDTVILIDDYDNFYYQFAELAKACEVIATDEIDMYRDFSIAVANTGNSIDFLVGGKTLLDLKSHTVYFPRYFIEREIEGQVLKEMTRCQIQIINGSRISGKSYFLAGLLRKIKNRDVYYFDSRSHIDKSLLEKLLNKSGSVLLIDTNVLDREATRLLFCSLKELERKQINVVLCVNNSDRDVLQMIRDNWIGQKDSLINSYSLEKRFSYVRTGKPEKKELELFNDRLKAENIIPFEKEKTILDNLIRIQGIMRARTPALFDKSIRISVGDTNKMCLIIMLVLNEKISAQEIVRCGLMQENADLLKEVKTAIEEDHCQLLSLESIELVTYQVVCNAHVWLLNQLRTLGSKQAFQKTIVEAFYHIVHSYLDGSKRYKMVEDYVKFDRLNEVFPNGKHLIQKIYDGLKPLMSDSYQYYHQYAKCRSWGMSGAKYGMEELNKARIAGETALQMVREYDVEKDFIHRMAYAHILNTVSIIYAKMCFLEKFREKQTIIDTCQFLLQAINCPDNYHAMKEAKYTRINSRDEDGGVLNKWIENMFRNSDLIVPSIRGQFQYILSYWRSL